MASVPFQRFRSILFDLLVVLSVAGLAGSTLAIRTAPHPAAIPGFVMAAALLVRRRWPLVTLGVVGAAALSQLGFREHSDPLPYDVAVLIAMYGAVKYGRRMLEAWLAAAVVGVGIVIEVVRTSGPGWWAVTLLYLGVCGGIWLAGYTVRARRIYVAGLEERAATLERERQHLDRIAVADERAAIARELHDVVAHSLAVMIVQADGGRYAFESEPERAREALTTVADTGRAALEDMRRLVGVLRGTGTEPEPDRRWATIEDLDALVEGARSAGLTVEVSTSGIAPPLPPAMELTVYRIVQEALTNVLRHAGRHAKVTLSMAYGPEDLTLSIVDDGGDRLDAPAGPERGVAMGNGLVGMRERVAVHGGRFEPGPRLDGGWSVEVTLPLGGPVESRWGR